MSVRLTGESHYYEEAYTDGRIMWPLERGHGGRLALTRAAAGLYQFSLRRTAHPLSGADRHDAPRLLDQFVPSVATMGKYVVVGCEDAV